MVLATNIQWGTASPKIYFDFSYEKKRSGSTQCYAVTVTCRPLMTTNSFFGYPIYVQISLDGSVKTTFTLKEPKPTYWGSNLTTTTGWLEVANKTSGTTALSIKVYSGAGSSRTGTYNYTLAVDPAASSISVNTVDIESNPTITIAKASPNFTHTILYNFGACAGIIANKTTATTINTWKIPYEFYAEIPSAKTGVGSLTCQTYSGNDLIGTSSCELTVTANEAKCKPTATGSVEDINPVTIALTGDKNILVRYLSHAKCSVSAEAKNLASISGRTVNGKAIIGDSLTFYEVETGSFAFTATDSRGFYKGDTQIKTLIPYEKLTANVTVQRTEPTSGEATLEIEGNYFNGSFGAVNNILKVQYRQGSGDFIEVTPTITDNRYSVSVPLTDADYTASLTYEVFVWDALSSITKTATLPKGTPVFDWGENDFNFNVPVYIKGVELVDYIVAALRERGLL